MYHPDKDKTTFMTERSNYRYQVMSFGLKNAGATNQRLMDKIFHELLGKTMKVYVHDMVVKLVKAEKHAAVLEVVFARVKRHEMCLNPEKCFFRVRGGKFLGFMIS